jgi:hypothetical protein
MRSHTLSLLALLLSGGLALGQTGGGPADPFQGQGWPFVTRVALDGSGDFTSIQAAIDHTNVGRTVLVLPGTYEEPIRMKDGVDVVGSGAGQTILDGRKFVPVVRGASYCRLEGFTITGYADDDIDGIQCEEVNEFTIANNLIKNCTWSGITAVRSSVTVRNNLICDNRTSGIYLTGATDVPSIIASNTICGNANEADIRLWNGAQAKITGNIIGDIDCETEKGSVATLHYNDVFAQEVGGDNLHADPLFADPDAGDYHVKSQAGRWDPARQAWVADDVTSPCIDAGDPFVPIGYEPFPNGGVVNLGAYGGTAEASKSWFGGPVCETIIAGDINGDCRVDFADLEILMRHWMEEF